MELFFGILLGLLGPGLAPLIHDSMIELYEEWKERKNDRIGGSWVYTPKRKKHVGKN